MGQIHCFKKSKKKLTIELVNRHNFKSLLEVKRENVIGKIHKLHRVKLECKQGIENCFYTKQKNIALVLRGYYWYIHQVLENFQRIVKEIDDIFCYAGTRMVHIKEVIKICEKELCQSEALLDNNVEKIMRNDTGNKNEISLKINEFLITRTEIKEENEIFFQCFNNTLTPRTTYRKLLRSKEP